MPPPKPAVVGGCVVAERSGGITPIQLAWTIDLEGIDGIEGMKNPTAAMKISYKGGAAEASGIPIQKGIITFDQAAGVGKISFDSLVINGGKKPVDLTKSWRKVFGKSLKVTAKGGQTAGPDCP